MRYLAIAVLVLLGLGVWFPPLYFTHALPLTPAICGGAAFSFAAYLAYPDRFLGWLKAIGDAHLPSIGGKDEPHA